MPATSSTRRASRPDGLERDGSAQPKRQPPNTGKSTHGSIRLCWAAAAPSLVTCTQEFGLMFAYTTPTNVQSRSVHGARVSGVSSLQQLVGPGADGSSPPKNKNARTDTAS